MAVGQDKLVPFVGAGMSKPIFPLWRDSLTKLIDDLPFENPPSKGEAKGMVRNSQFEEAASLLERELHTPLTALIYADFCNDRIEEQESRLAQMPVSLLPDLFTGSVITTNYDRVVEWVYHGRLEPVVPPFHNRPGQLVAIRRQKSRLLIKIHGCISSERDLIFTKESYDEFYGEDFRGESALFLKDLLMTREALFLGCGLQQDRTFKLMTDLACTVDATHFAIVEAPEKPAPAEFRNRWESLKTARIRCYWYPYGAHTRIEEVLRFLIDPNGSDPPGDVDITFNDKPPSEGGGSTVTTPPRLPIGGPTAGSEAPASSPAPPLPVPQPDGVEDAPSPTSQPPADRPPATDPDTAPYGVARLDLRPTTDPIPPSVTLPPASTTLIVRDQELQKVTQALTDGHGAALIGMGGIGKTTLAQEYVRAHADKYSWVWWLDASTEGALASSLAEEGRRAVSATGAGGVTLVTDDTAEAYARRLLRNGTDWLMVLDGAAGVDEVRSVIAETPQGKFLVTTREDQDWQDIGATPVKVDLLSKHDAVRLLAERARPPSPDGWEATGSAGDLVKALGYLPLAVAQVGALLHFEGATDPSGMLAQLQENPEAHLVAAAPGTPPKRTMAHIWDLSIARLEERDRSAVQLLSILGWLGPPEGIPKSLLDTLPRDAFPNGPGRALRAAASASLLTMRGDLITIHPVLHRVLRIADKTVPQRTGDRVDKARATAAAMLRQVLGDADPTNPSAWPTIRPLVESAGLLATQPAAGQDEDASYVVRKVGQFLSGQGSHDRAVALLEWDLKRAEHALKPNDPKIPTARRHLADALQERRRPGDLDQAITLLQSVLTDRERVLSTDHPSTLNTRHNLAGAFT
ncbi:MAG: SIR2 family protein, partial [Bifidobacteriaceae bacterium]|nr:SIR2 family protein [Bifidobacteriaceae bacterium]